MQSDDDADANKQFSKRKKESTVRKNNETLDLDLANGKSQMAAEKYCIATKGDESIAEQTLERMDCGDAQASKRADGITTNVEGISGSNTTVTSVVNKSSNAGSSDEIEIHATEVSSDNNINSDIEILDGSSSEEDKSCKNKNTKNHSGNLNVIPSSPNADLSTKLENVNLKNEDKGNVIIVDETTSRKEDSISDSCDTSSVSEAEDDCSVNGTPSGNKFDSEEVISGQKKRNMQQKKINKKAKREMEENSESKTKDSECGVQESKTEKDIAILKHQGISRDDHEKTSSSAVTDSDQISPAPESDTRNSGNKQVFGQALDWKNKGTASPHRESSLFEMKSNQTKRPKISEDSCGQSEKMGIDEEDENKKDEGEAKEKGNENDGGTSVDPISSRMQTETTKKKKRKMEIMK